MLEIQKVRASQVIPDRGVFDEPTGLIAICHSTLGNVTHVFSSDATCNKYT